MIENLSTIFVGMLLFGILALVAVFVWKKINRAANSNVDVTGTSDLGKAILGASAPASLETIFGQLWKIIKEAQYPQVLEQIETKVKDIYSRVERAVQDISATIPGLLAAIAREEKVISDYAARIEKMNSLHDADDEEKNLLAMLSGEKETHESWLETLRQNLAEVKRHVLALQKNLMVIYQQLGVITDRKPSLIAIHASSGDIQSALYRNRGVLNANVMVQFKEVESEILKKAKAVNKLLDEYTRQVSAELDKGQVTRPAPSLLQQSDEMLARRNVQPAPVS